MSFPFVQLCFRQIIDASAASEFERNVFNDSYDEMLMQIQVFNANGAFKTWQQLKQQNGKAAHNVPYKTAFAIGLYMQGLQQCIPGFTDNLGNSINFQNYNFQILESDFGNRQLHKVAICYNTPPLQLIAVMGNYLLLSLYPAPDSETFTLVLQPGISIVKYHGVEEEHAWEGINRLSWSGL